MTSRPRVLYAPRNISGQASEYAAAIRGLGHDAEVWSYGPPAFGFHADRVLDKDRLRTDAAHRWDVLDDAIRRFDVFHLQYGRSLLDPLDVRVPDLWDIPLLKSLGKKVFMHWRGSDVRLPSVHRQREQHSYFLSSQVPSDEDRILGKVAICRRFCDGMFVSTPGLLDYVPDATWIPHVIDVAAWGAPERTEPDVPLVVHIPSNRGIKGSDHVGRAGVRLMEQGAIRYRELQGLDREQVRTALQDADVVVDSLTIGDHGLISVEGMAASTVAVAHVHETNRERNPGVPVVEATPDTVEQVLGELAADPGLRRDLKERSLDWVRRRHDRNVVGPLLTQAYRAPARTPISAYPDWPRSDGQERVRQLEHEIDKLRAGGDPLLGMVSVFETDASKFAVGRLVARISELEAALAAADSGSDLLSRPALPGLAIRAKEIIRANPTAHRAARRAARLLGW